MKKDSVLKDMIKELKEEFSLFHSIGWRGYGFVVCLIWVFFWMMAVDSENDTAFLLSIAFMLAGTVSAGGIFLSVLLEELKDTKK